MTIQCPASSVVITTNRYVIVIGKLLIPSGRFHVNRLKHHGVIGALNAGIAWLPRY
jgi:hypothetical protein